MNIQHKTQRLKQLVGIRDSIKLDPSWQRGGVWTPPKQALLIDSILRGYDIPMVYLWDRGQSLPYRYEVVDGQQRLTAIWEFIDGKFCLSKDAPRVGNTRIANKAYEDLPKTLKSKFDRFEVVIAYITKARQPEISEVFSRMQMGVRLNPAELRNAIQSGYRQAIDTVARLNKFFTHSKIPSARFKHQDYLAHALSVCHHGGKRDAKASQLHDDYIYLSNPSDYVSLLATANDILDFLEQVNELSSKRITQKWIFVDLFYFLYRHRAQIGKLNVAEFTSVYLAFDDGRRQHNAEPEELLLGSANTQNKDLYNYIMAFKIGGGERSNINQRADVLARRFKTVLGKK